MQPTAAPSLPTQATVGFSLESADRYVFVIPDEVCLHLPTVGGHQLLFRPSGLIWVACIHLSVASSIYRLMDEAIDAHQLPAGVGQISQRHPVYDGAIKSETPPGWRAFLRPIGRDPFSLDEGLQELDSQLAGLGSRAVVAAFTDAVKKGYAGCVSDA